VISKRITALYDACTLVKKRPVGEGEGMSYRVTTIQGYDFLLLA
jgi:hypothetical protein